MSTHHRQTQALSDMWELLLRYRSRFVLPAFLAAAAVLAVGVLLPRKYQAEATFERRTDMVLAEMTNRGASQGFQNPRSSAVEEIVGQPAIEQLITDLHPDIVSGRVGRRVGTDLDGLRSDLQRMLLVHYDISSPELDRIRVSYTATNPELARLVVNRLVEGYIRRTRDAMDGRLKESADFFASEVNRERGTIEQIENQMLTFEVSHAEMLPDSPTNIQTEINQAQGTVADLESRLQAAVIHEKALSDAINGTSATSPSVTTGPNPEYQRLGQKVRDLETQLSTDIGTLKMTERHPDVIALRSQLAATRAELGSTPPQAVVQTQTSANPKRGEMEVMVTNAQADRQGLDSQLTTARARLAKLQEESTSLFPVRADYRKLSRDADQHRRQLTFWEENLRRVRMALTAESGNRGVRLDFIQPCTTLTHPVAPNLMQVLLAALGLGAMAGAAGVVLAHRGDETFPDAQALASSTDLPLLGSVSEIISRGERRTRRLRNLFLKPLESLAMLAILFLLATALYLRLERPEVFARLRQHPNALFHHPTASAGDSPARE